MKRVRTVTPYIPELEDVRLISDQVNHLFMGIPDQIQMPLDLIDLLVFAHNRHEVEVQVPTSIDVSVDVWSDSHEAIRLLCLVTRENQMMMRKYQTLLRIVEQQDDHIRRLKSEVMDCKAIMNQYMCCPGFQDWCATGCL